MTDRHTDEARRAEPAIRAARPEDRDHIVRLTRDAYAEYATRMDPAAWSALAQAMDRLWKERGRARELGQAGLARYRELGLNWQGVIQELLR